jgi:hypothetical protein
VCSFDALASNELAVLAVVKLRERGTTRFYLALHRVAVVTRSPRRIVGVCFMTMCEYVPCSLTMCRSE